MDEALEEVPLGRCGCAPGELELLVRGEVRPRAEVLEPRPQSPGDGFVPHRERGTLAAVATILLAGVDLFFRGKLEGLLGGHRLVTSDSAHLPDLVIADIARVEPQDVADAFPDTPILGFANHTDTAGLRRAHAAGFDQVIVKAALVERAGQLVEELTAPVK